MFVLHLKLSNFKNLNFLNIQYYHMLFLGFFPLKSTLAQGHVFTPQIKLYFGVSDTQWNMLYFRTVEGSLRKDYGKYLLQ